MTRRLVVSALPGQTRAAWICDGTLEDLVVLRDDRPSLLGNVYLGRVTAIDCGLDAAFVEIGVGCPAFLPLEDLGGLRPHEGQSLVVRVTREAAGQKGPKLSMKLAPDLRRILATKDGAGAPPKLLFRALDPLDRVLAAKHPPDDIVTDDPGFFETARDRLGGMSGHTPHVALYRHTRPLFEAEGLEAGIEALLDPAVALSSGGSLLIEPTRTLTAIDVNAGRQRERDPESLALGVNLEAAAEAARQIRLRSLSGLIVIDFLALAERRDRQEVVRALRRAVKVDTEPTRVHPMSPSGLVEMTRRRGRPPLYEVLTEPCGIYGSGRVKDPVTLAYEALTSLRAQATGVALKQLRLHVGPVVGAALEGPAAMALDRIETQLGRSIEIVVEAGRAGDSFEIMLG